MGIETFDDFDSGDLAASAGEVKPFAFRENKTEKGTLEWLNANFDMCERHSQSRLRNYQKWNSLYKGIHWRSMNNSRGEERDMTASDKKPRMVDNFIMEFIDTKVAQMARLGSNFTAIPWNDEQDDINNAKACQKLLKARADQINFDSLCMEFDRARFKYGTAFLMVKWNPDLGPIDPRLLELKEIYKDVGDLPADVSKKLKHHSIKIGDVEVCVKTPDCIYPQLHKESWEKVEYFDEILDWVHIEELKAEYPDKAILMKDNSRVYWNYSTNEITKPAELIMVRGFYHIPTKFFPKGCFIKYTDDAILEWTDYPFKHGSLPMAIGRDVVHDKELWGRPAIGQIEQKQRQYNNIDSSIARDLGVGSAPKWLAAKGSVDFRSLNNEATIVEFKGPVAPVLVKNNPISGDALLIQDRMEKRMGKLVKVYDISRGEVPAGVTANSALRFLDEQENQVLIEDEKKRKRAVLDTYRLMIKVMSQYYTKEDGRTIRILGKDNSPLIESLGKADFNQIYDVQFQNTSALPDTKTGKIAAITDLNMATQTDPVFRRDDVIQLLDMGMDEAFVDRATVSLNAAKAIYESMLAGQPVPEPEMHMDLLPHYTTFYKAIQSLHFMTKVKPQIQQSIYTHIKTLEGLLFLKAERNQKLAMELQKLEYFPSFFELPPAPPAPMGMPPQDMSVQQPIDPSAMGNTQEDINAAREAEIE